MKKVIDIANAANSKTMNAVENIKLYAAAGDADPVIEFQEPSPGPGKDAEKDKSKNSKGRKKKGVK